MHLLHWLLQSYPAPVTVPAESVVPPLAIDGATGVILKSKLAGMYYLLLTEH
jgi:hypothetical protein